MKINISEVVTNSVFSEVKASAGNEVVGGLDFSAFTVDANSIGITNYKGFKPKSAWANSSVQGIVDVGLSAGTLQSEANWNGGVIVKH